MKRPEFTKGDIKALTESPEALRALADIHSVWETEASALEFGGSADYHMTRRIALREAAMFVQHEHEVEERHPQYEDVAGVTKPKLPAMELPVPKKVNPHNRLLSNWRVGVFWSSSTPNKQVRLLAEGQDEIEDMTKHRDFVRWEYCSDLPQANQRDAKVINVLQAFVSLYKAKDWDGDWACTEAISILRELGIQITE